VGLATVLAVLLSPGAGGQETGDLSQSPEWSLLDDYCVECHNFDDYAGGLALDTLELSTFHAEAETWETIVRKLRTGLMPPAGERRPIREELDAVARWAEEGLDAAGDIDPGTRPLARLN